MDNNKLIEKYKKRREREREKNHIPILFRTIRCDTKVYIHMYLSLKRNPASPSFTFLPRERAFVSKG